MGAGCSRACGGCAWPCLGPVRIAPAGQPAAPVKPVKTVDTPTPTKVAAQPVPTTSPALPTPPPAAAAVSLKSGVERRITFAHFNDIYNIEPAAREPVGGAARLAWTVKSMAQDHPLVVFSGDAFNPSLLSTVTLGAQMPPVLNEIGVNIACIGNHDFDFGTAQLQKLVKQCTFPWLMANVLDKETKKPYAGALATQIVDWHGVKVGFVGLVEEEWLETLGAVNPNEMEYVDFVEVGHRLAAELQAQGAELLVAITHMRVPNDQRLCRECPEFTVVMGGHDHHYHVEVVEPHNVLLVKSGTDFRDLTRVEVVLPADGGKPQASHTRLTMTKEVPEDPTVAKIVDGYMGKMLERMSEVIGHSYVDLDGRFTTVRTQESNLGNLLCDCVRTATNTDVVLINGGTFRSDTIHKAGPFTLGDLMSVLPMMDGTLVLEVTGEQLLQGLENGVCMYPKLEGRFPQVSGVSFMFDPSAPPRQRIVAGSVLVGGAPMQLDKKYTMCTKPYVADGKDGYDVFKQCKVLVPEEGGVMLPTVLRNHFRYLDVLNYWCPKPRAAKFAKRWRSAVMRKKSGSTSALKHSQSVSASKPMDDFLQDDEMAAIVQDIDNEPLPARTNVQPDTVCSLGGEDMRYGIRPQADGRIMMLQDKQ